MNIAQNQSYSRTIVRLSNPVISLLSFSILHWDFLPFYTFPLSLRILFSGSALPLHIMIFFYLWMYWRMPPCLLHHQDDKFLGRIHSTLILVPCLSSLEFVGQSLAGNLKAPFYWLEVGSLECGLPFVLLQQKERQCIIDKNCSTSFE